MPYPPSSFESMVGNFLNSYGAVKGIQRDRSEQAIREQAAKRQDQMAQVQLDEAGYDRLTMPTIGAPPDQSFAQKVGRFLSGGTPAPSEIIVKTHPSAHDTDVANAQAFETSRDTARFGQQTLLEGIKAQQAAALEKARQDAENQRASGHDAARIKAAGISATARGPNTMTGLTHAGTAVNSQIMQTNREITAAQKVKSTGLSRRATPADSADYNTAVGGIPALVAKRDSLQGVYGGIAARMQGATNPGGAPVSDADLWEHLVGQGLSADEATAQVKARHQK